MDKKTEGIIAMVFAIVGIVIGIIGGISCTAGIVLIVTYFLGINRIWLPLILLVFGFLCECGTAICRFVTTTMRGEE